VPEGTKENGEKYETLLSLFIPWRWREGSELGCNSGIDSRHPPPTGRAQTQNVTNQNVLARKVNGIWEISIKPSHVSNKNGESGDESRVMRDLSLIYSASGG